MNETQTGKSSSELDSLINQTNKLNLSIKNRIKGKLLEGGCSFGKRAVSPTWRILTLFFLFSFAALEASNAGLPNNSDANIRRSQVAKLKKNFMDSIMRYQDVERTYQQKYRQRMERQIKIGKE